MHQVGGGAQKGIQLLIKEHATKVETKTEGQTLAPDRMHPFGSDPSLNDGG